MTRTINTPERERRQRLIAALRREQVRHGLKDNDVVALLGIHEKTVAGWFAGLTVPTGARLHAVQELLTILHDTKPGGQMPPKTAPPPSPSAQPAPLPADLFRPIKAPAYWAPAEKQPATATVLPYVIAAAFGGIGGLLVALAVLR